MTEGRRILAKEFERTICDPSKHDAILMKVVRTAQDVEEKRQALAAFAFRVGRMDNTGWLWRERRDWRPEGCWS